MPSRGSRCRPPAFAGPAGSLRGASVLLVRRSPIGPITAFRSLQTPSVNLSGDRQVADHRRQPADRSPLPRAIGRIFLVIGDLLIELSAYLCRFWHFWEADRCDRPVRGPSRLFLPKRTPSLRLRHGGRKSFRKGEGGGPSGIAVDRWSSRASRMLPVPATPFRCSGKRRSGRSPSSRSHYWA
jgi:hypothetical protein